MTTNILDHGAKGDGRTDDTAAIQKALDLYSGKPIAGVIDIPIGDYRISKTLTYRGTTGAGIRIRGEQASSGPDGAVLRWVGEPGGTVLQLLGANATSVEHLAIDAAKATNGISVAYDHDRNAGASNVTLDHVIIGAGSGAAVSLGMKPDGSPDNYQCDFILMNKCLMVGDRNRCKYGVLTGIANAKNFAIRDCGIVGFGTGIKHGGSGYMLVSGFTGGSNGVDVEASTSNVDLHGGNSEGSAMLFRGTTGVNAGTVSIRNWQWGGTAPDEFVVSYQGYLEMVGNHFWNDLYSNAICKVRLLVGAGSPATLDSRGNYWANLMSGGIPVFDGMGKRVVAPNLRSFGDYGGKDGPKIKLKVIR